ncbi:hypothetical protein SAMN06297387_10510 [Streptomyces zhaozhouensis]|uniref:Uncharacterized protein n=1 Tax=Streptomyces zhaozhouensis TaxID=1300267 RepID=A0A286DU48_9ACTN|nr:hypothetical protein [Streptomyces zhaozhouensis]SOD62195.1 hypothetical protein SAMN06297387_10510 [Streptomyces zhaozhouensis]
MHATRAHRRGRRHPAAPGGLPCAAAALVLTAVICGAALLPHGTGAAHTALSAVSTGKDWNNTG